MGAIEKNESMLDRFVRIIIGGVLMISTTFIAMSGLLQALLIVIGLYLLFSALAGACFVYKFMGKKTC
ncbi:MAG: DUF2892 domain-containing protein [Candidatus Saganbacteria bacterium]|nr:DUF2892 domain-containing protein [Candidatus Saganbacteria bacterium]